MNSKDRPALTVESLLAMRSEPDAVRVITERLGVKDMGPADHIRTKHEVKAFVDSGEGRSAEGLLRRATERLASNQRINESNAQRQGRRLNN